MALGFMLIGALNPNRQGDELWGWRALILAPLCLVLSAIAAGMDWSPRWSRWAEPLGDATYGLYLLHPILFWGSMAAVTRWADWPQAVEWPLALKLGFAGAVFVSAFVLAVASERHFERPLREWSRRRRRLSP